MSVAEHLLHAALLSQVAITDGLTPLRAALYRRLQGAGWRPSLQPVRGAPPQRRTDEALLSAFLAGDAEAFEQLAERHLGRLAGYARKNLPHSGDADDLVHETMLVLLRRGPDILAHSTPNVAAFLFGTLRNLIRKALAARQSTTLDDAPETAEEVDLTDQLGEREHQSRLIRLIERTCNVLEQDVLAFVLDGFKNTEIAAKLGVKAGHVGKLKHDAIQKVREALKKEVS